MKNKLLMQGALCAMLMGIAAGEAQAAQTLRVQVDQKGDFLLIGNTLGHDCAAGTPAPVAGTVSNCGNSTNDTAPDIFWQSDAPMAGQAQANNMVAVGQARSTAILTIPAGATVSHAFLYWGAALPGGDMTATLDRPGVFSQDLTAAQMYTSISDSYQSVADITAIVQAQGSGAYRVSGVGSSALVNQNINVLYAGWWMVVFYELGTDPPRNLALFDGLDNVSSGSPQNLTLTGFLVPPVFTNAKLGVVSFEGDNTISGDSFSFGPAPALSNAVNAADNFFNGSHSFLGLPVSTFGDLPQLTGGPQSMSGIDIDVVDVTAKLTAGLTSVAISATSTQDQYYLGGFVTSIPTYKPNFSTSLKSAVDVNGGSLLPGDLVEYTIVAANSGNDTSVNTVLTDPLPVGVTYAPGTTSISTGPNTGTKTDATGDDQCEYIAGTRTVLCRLGTGANGVNGGEMVVGDTSTVKFRVTVDANAIGTILNQATITAGGKLGAPAEGTPTDGNGVTNGEPPTPIIIEACETDAQCMAPTPICNVAADPNACVQCLTDTHCPGTAPTCDIQTNQCVCVLPGMPEVCDSKDNDCDGVVDEGCTDTDGDGLPDMLEQEYGTDPNDADSDDDGVPDGAEIDPDVDSDGDGLINALDSDSDNDGLFDGTEMGLGCSNPATNPNANQCIPDADMGATTTDPLNPDTDNGGVPDGSEDFNKNGQIDPGEGDPNNQADDSTLMDTDGDGLSDGFETQIGSDPLDADSDDDGVPDGQEPNPAADSDGDGLINVLDADSDNDGLFDGTEMGFDCSNPATDTSKNRCIDDADKDAPPTSPINPDTDGGGISDGSEDTNKDGRIDPGEGNPNNPADDSTLVDTDGDGLTDAFETAIGSDPNDADSDEDGVPDGQEANPTEDTDGDGLINVLDPDSDNDGLFDGTELGLDCSNPATDPAQETCIPDADKGATTTSPLDPDTDNGGVPDGSEDINKNGTVDPGEGDPNNPADDSTFVDSDGDGLSDPFETSIGSDPNDADSDDDGVSDGQEPNPTVDSDGDGLLNVLDSDSDNDGLADGTEMGFDCSNPDTDTSKNRCIPDADKGGTKTSPIDLDTDDGGISDGSEDINKNGTVDPGEGDPNDPTDDSTIIDTDGDGLSDSFETAIGSDPNDADSDDDGVIDGKEANPAEDTDGDGKINVLDPDSDDDGLFDGTELGFDCSNAATSPTANNCVADADNGATTTSPLNPDTDGGGVPDGLEDGNHNGTIDSGEGDPSDPIDDIACTKDADCGNTTSGKVCNATAKVCVPGCRGTNGNGCPAEQTCSSRDDTAGTCSAGNDPNGILITGGCVCSTGSNGTSDSPVGFGLAIAAACAAVVRRRKH